MAIRSIEWANRSLANDYGDSRGANSPSTVELRLYTADPNNGGTEFSGAGYAALTVANTSANFPAPDGGEIVTPWLEVFTPTEDVDNPPLWWQLVDPSTGGLMDGEALAAPVAGVAGTPIRVRCRIRYSPTSLLEA